jgi:prolyl oligopeptidase
MASQLHLKRRAWALGLLVLLPACGSAPAGGTESLRPPPTRKVDAADDYHGTLVPDPYRWLEDQDSDETRRWVAAQNGYADALFSRIGARAGIRTRLEEIGNYPRRTPPEKHGPWWIWRTNDGLQNQAVIRRARSPEDPGEILLDPNTLSTEGTVAIGQLAFSNDGDFVACARSASGSDWIEWRVLEVESGKELFDRVPWCKFAGAAWTHDGAGFFYQRYPAPQPGATHEACNEKPQLCYHRLGDDASADKVVYERPDEPSWGYRPRVTEDGRWLVLEISSGTDERNRIAYVDLMRPDDGVRPLLMAFDAAYDFLGNEGTTWYLLTDKEAKRYRIAAIDIAATEPSLRTVVVESEATIAAARLVGDELVLVRMKDATHVVQRFGLDGRPRGDIVLPGLGTAAGFTGERKDRSTFFTFTSFLTPGTVLRFDFDSARTTTWYEPPLRFDPRPLVVKQVFYQSKDATRVPMFVLHDQRIALDGNNRTFLYGYGGFNIPVLPSFSSFLIAWCERGGVYAQACLRGGGEYGDDWHKAGMLKNKQNVFDDFVAAAHYLTRNGYATPNKLAIGGRSNGGLLVGAVLTQHPGLFGAAVPEVGVLDMLRYHKFTIGWAWASDYGRSDDPEMFPVLHAYSPLHRVQPGTSYPPTLIMTGDHDDRVLPGHSYKFAAALQEAQAGPAPIVLRVDTDAGHGAGKPTHKQIDEAADRLAFLEWALR